MQVPTVNKVHRTRNIEKAVEAPQSLAILEYIALDNAKGRILKYEDVLIGQEQGVSKSGETNKIEA